MKYLLLILLAVLGPLIYWRLDSPSRDRGQPQAVAVTPAVQEAAAGSATDPWAEVLLARDAVPPPLISDPWLIRVSGEDAGDVRDHYNQKLLHLILDKTVPTYGAYKVVTGENFNRLRSFVEVHDRRLDVTWSVSSQLREQVLLPVRREIVRGLHGYRLFLIRKGDQARFSGVKNLDDLRRLKAGGGHDWQPTEVWRANGLPIVTSDKYQTLFQMLNHGRFDYFSRALFEPEKELVNHPNAGLQLEQELIAHFPASCYFFVHPSRVDLAKRLEAGMDLALADGSFAALFEQVSEFAALKKSLHVAGRRFLELKNPFEPADGRGGDKRFLFTPADLVRHYP